MLTYKSMYFPFLQLRIMHGRKKYLPDVVGKIKTSLQKLRNVLVNI